ncbi:MAG: endonuclease III [Clostridiales bacterium]|nr:endonuclease III [Clostridiales bacterium]
MGTTVEKTTKKPEDKKRVLSKKEILEILDELEKLYPDAKCELDYNSPFELLIAVILSAQCTDKRVNIITKQLFQNHNTADKILKLNAQQLGEIIKSCGFYRVKSQNILKTCEIIVSEHGGKVPRTMDKLVNLYGVGRKTANVILSNVYGQQAIAVDTHVFRVSNRIGIVKAKNVLDTEKQLMKNIPQNMWSRSHHLLIFHGRRVCSARKPKCSFCTLNDLCMYF